MQIFNKKENWNTEAFFPNDRTMSCKSKQKKVNLSYLFSSSSGHTTPWGFLILGSRRLYGFLQRIIEKCNISYQQNLSFWKKTWNKRKTIRLRTAYIFASAASLRVSHNFQTNHAENSARRQNSRAFHDCSRAVFFSSKWREFNGHGANNTSEENTWSKIS